jgi:hypothetical protein
MLVSKIQTSDKMHLKTVLAKDMLKWDLHHGTTRILRRLKP